MIYRAGWPSSSATRTAPATCRSPSSWRCSKTRIYSYIWIHTCTCIYIYIYICYTCVCVYTYVYIYIYIYIHTHMYIRRRVMSVPNICLSLHLSICLSVYLSVLSVYIPVCLSVYRSIRPSIRLSVYLYLCVCPSADAAHLNWRLLSWIPKILP